MLGNLLYKFGGKKSHFCTINENIKYSVCVEAYGPISAPTAPVLGPAAPLFEVSTK